MAARWFSTVYYNAPMPHAIFFHGGFAIHGSYDIARAWRTRIAWLHPPASKRCGHIVRSRAARRRAQHHHCGALEHDPEKWKPVFRKDHAPPKS
jgi:hypothetical protein